MPCSLKKSFKQPLDEKRSTFLFRISILLSITQRILQGCINSKKIQIENSGTIEIQTTLTDIFGKGEDSSGYLNLSEKKWFKDSLIIQEVRTLNIKTDTFDITSRKYDLNCYLFKNLKSGEIYEYLNFSVLQSQ